MSLREEFKREHPDFPMLEVDNVDQLQQYLAGCGWLGVDETLESCGKAGEGNMNLALRLVTNQRTLVLKQARPWVEKYDHIAAPWRRVHFEQRYYEATKTIPEVARHSPKIIASDSASHCILMDYLEGASDFTDLYAGGTITENEVEGLASYLVALHTATRGGFDESLANRDMRALNHEHIFVIPLAKDNGLDLESFEPGLAEIAVQLKDDSALLETISALGDRYFSDGACLLHGDFFPGSWLRTDNGLYVIDPEFCYYGDPEFDVAVVLAHFTMARVEPALAEDFCTAYVDGVGHDACDLGLVARYAGAEIIRRVIGVAQLPIPPSQDFRGKLLLHAQRTVLDSSLDNLIGIGTHA